MMNLTTEQRNAVRESHNTLVTACPGSGKTRTLIAKIIRCVDDVRGTPRRIACITYTNTAVNEIEHRIRLHGTYDALEYVDTSTIHAFCLRNIFGPHHWRLGHYRNGFRILPSDTEEYIEIVNEICEHHRIRVGVEQFELLQRDQSGKPVQGPSSQIPDEVALDFWAALQAKGFVDFSSLIYFSYLILVQNPSLADALSGQYAWMCIDEFQDTSALQVEVFRLISSYGNTKFFLVGDPCQSIYDFTARRSEF